MAPRAIWSGVLTFGMVSIPIKLYTATENKDISFNQLHRDCMARIKQQRVCSACEKQLESDDIEKGYEYGKGQYVVVTDEDLEKLPLPNKGAIEISKFVKAAEIDPVFYDKSYYVEPDEAAKKPFKLFMQSMLNKNMTAVASVAIRSKQRLCALRPMDGTLMMSTLLYPDEIRVEKGKPLPSVEVSDKELDMADSLIDMMTEPFDVTGYKDHYREALLSIIEAKLDGKEVVAAPAPPAGKVVDLMEALQASMESLKNKKKVDAEQAKEPVAVAAEPANAASRRTKKAAAG